jgi:Kef-type K+ transport system membrane component KefB
VGTAKRVLLVAAMFGLVEAVRSFAADSAEPARGAAIVLGVGFVLVTALFVGKVFALLRLPKLTGYLATGVIAGPAAIGYLSEPVVEGLALVNGMAIGLIALTGGSEMDFRAMRPLLKSIAAISGIAVLGTAILLGLVAFLARDTLPFLVGMPMSSQLAISAVLGAVVVAQSPAIVVAIRAETNADGPVARTVLGVVVLADLLVIVLFALLSAIATATIAGSADVAETARSVTWELFGSIAVGVLVGGLLSLYMRVVARALDLFVLAVCLVAAEIGQQVHLDPLIVMLAAGMFVENVMRQGAELRASFEAASLPVYILFFTVAGASIDLDAIPILAVPTALLVLVRAVGLYGGTRLAARVAAAPDTVRRWAGLGLLPQAGLANALAVLFARSFPELGPTATTLTLSVVAVNALIAPALLRHAFVRAGEVVDRPPSLAEGIPPPKADAAARPDREGRA